VLVTGCYGERDAAGRDEQQGQGTPGPAVPVSNARQPGVDSPVPRQRFLGIQVFDLHSGVDDAADALDALGRAVTALGTDHQLTTTVAVGPRVVRATCGAETVGAVDLPVFAGEQVADGDRGGDLFVQVCADLQRTVRSAEAGLAAALAEWATPRWSDEGFRGEADGRGVRNILGFYDGVAVPTSAADLDSDVWTDDTDGLADATVVVVRRLRIDTARFRRLDVAAQEAVFGRHKRSGSPLSGGSIDDDVDLQAKSESGVYDIPVSAHVRRAHPFTGGAERLMLRRSYSYDHGAGDRGLLFVSFQRELAMFVDTQRAMDDGDALMSYATATGSGTWLVLPWDRTTPLGSVLRT
jgi:dye decolorizing peroxidase